MIGCIIIIITFTYIIIHCLLPLINPCWHGPHLVTIIAQCKYVQIYTRRQHQISDRISSSPSPSNLIVGSLRKTQLVSSSQFCHGLHLSLSRWLSCLGSHGPSISALVFLFFFFRVVSSPESFFPRILGLVFSCIHTTSVSLSCTSV